MAVRNIVVVGASAGGVEALIKIIRGLPTSLEAAILCVVHLSSNSDSDLAKILDSVGGLPVSTPLGGETIENGWVFIAPPKYHLLVNDGKVKLSNGPRENGHRPSIDSLFRSASHFYGPRVIGIVLSGMLDDGSGGLVTIKRRGGLAIVQDPAEALFPDMPRNAMAATSVDHVLKIREIVERLPLLVKKELPSEEKTMDNEITEVSPDERENRGMKGELEKPPTAFRCPECGGALWELEDGNTIQYACHVGHAYSQQTLIEDNNKEIEAALWSALRILQERVAICKRLAERATDHGIQNANRFAEEAKVTQDRADLLKRVLNKELI